MINSIEEATPGADEACEEPAGIADPPQVIPAFSATELTAAATLYVGSHARFVALDNGAQLQIQNSAGEWIAQQDYTEE